ADVILHGMESNLTRWSEFFEDSSLFLQSLREHSRPLASLFHFMKSVLPFFSAERDFSGVTITKELVSRSKTQDGRT
ncbi:MAG TPA: hypothetical protein VEI57_08225, partial [Nitrospirota bacterium]|nr:hypothetical protein [Nitrospirota bacterium]